MRQFQGALLSLLLFSLVLVSGCGSSNNDQVFTNSGNGGNGAANTGSVQVNFQLLARAVPTDISEFRFIAFDAAGGVVYGPKVVAKAATITLDGVSTSTAKFRIEYLQNGVVRGFYETPLTVPANGTVVINDPPFQDVGSNVARIEVTPVSDIMPLGSSRQFVATAILTDGKTTDVTSSAVWTSSDESILQVSNTVGSHGLATALAVGRAELTASFGEATGSESVTISSAALQRVEVTPGVAVIPNGATQQFSAVGHYSDGTIENLTSQVTWTSTSGAVASVSNAGLSRALTAGQSTITATEAKSGLSSSSSLTVTASVLSEIQVFPTNPTVANGQLLQFTAVGLYSDGQEENITSLVNWTSSSAAVATISNAAGTDGLASTLAQGQTTVTASFQGISGQTQLTVAASQLEYLEISPFTPLVSVGGTQQFTVIGVYSNNTKLDLTQSVSFASSNGAVARVSNDVATRGLATGLTQGQSTITATHTASGLQTEAVLQVNSATLRSIAVTPANSTIASGLSEQFVAIGTYSDGSTRDISTLVTWASSADATARISNASGTRGLATTATPGPATISATEPVSGVSGSTLLTVSNAVLRSIAIDPINPSTPVGGLVYFKATGTYSDDTTRDLTQSVNWQSSNTAIADIENRPGPDSGESEGFAVGSTTITATDSATNVKASTVLTVTPVTIERIDIQPSNTTIGTLEIQQFLAFGVYTDGSRVNLTRKVVWRSSDLLVLPISNLIPGTAIGLLPGKATVTASFPLLDLKGSTTVTVSNR